MNRLNNPNVLTNHTHHTFMAWCLRCNEFTPHIYCRLIRRSFCCQHNHAERHTPAIIQHMFPYQEGS